MRMRVELALIVGIVFFCCWCAYIMVSMNGSVAISAGLPAQNLPQEIGSKEATRNDNKTRLVPADSLEAAIRRLPVGQYVISEAHLSLPGDYSSVRASQNQHQQPGAFQGVSEQSAWPRHAAPEPEGAEQQLPAAEPEPEPDPDGELLNAGYSPEVNSQEENQEPRSEPSQDQPGELEGGEGEEEEESTRPEVAGPQSEFEERLGGRSFSENSDSEKERDRTGEIVTERWRHFINGRPVGGQLGAEGQSKPAEALREAASNPNPARNNNNNNNKLGIRLSDGGGQIDSGSPPDTSQPRRGKPEKGGSFVRVGGQGQLPLAAASKAPGELNNRPPDGQQTDPPEGRLAEPALTRRLGGGSKEDNKSPPGETDGEKQAPFPAKLRFNNSRKGDGENNESSLEKSFAKSRPLLSKTTTATLRRNKKTEKQPEEIDEQSSGELEPKRKRKRKLKEQEDSHEHKVRESLRAQTWDDDSKMSPAGDDATESSTPGVETEEGEEPERVEFEDLDLLVDSEKFPFMDSSRRRRRSVELEGNRSGHFDFSPLIEFDDDVEELDSSKPSQLNDGPNMMSISDNNSSKNVSTSKEERLKVEANNSNNPIATTNSTFEASQSSAGLAKAEAPMNSPGTNDTAASHSNIISVREGPRPQFRRLDAQEDLAIEVLASRPGQPEGNGSSFLISAVPDRPSSASFENQAYYNPLGITVSGSGDGQLPEAPQQYKTSGSKAKGKKVKYVKLAKSHKEAKKKAKGYKSKKRSKVKKGGAKKKKINQKRKFVKNYKDFKGSTKGKKGKRGYGKKGGKNGKLYYTDKGYRKKGFKKNYQKFETGDHKTYFDEFRDKDHSKKWKDFNDKHHYSQSKKWAGNDKKKYNNFAYKSSKGKKHGQGSWKEKDDSKFLKSYKSKKEKSSKHEKKKKKKKEEKDRK